MMAKAILGFVWMIVIYFLTCLLVGGVAAFVAGYNDPGDGFEAGQRAGEAVLLAYGLYFFHRSNYFICLWHLV